MQISLVTITKLVMTFGYISIALELVMFHVPSVASSRNIWTPKSGIIKYYTGKYREIFDMGIWKKILFFTLPLGIVYIMYLIPFFYLFEYKTGKLNILFQTYYVHFILGIFLMILGRYITFSSVLTIRKENEQTNDSFKLHTDGLFSKMRNPGLLGLYMFFIGIWIVFPSLYLLVGILTYIMYMHFKILMEENFLKNKYGDEYKVFLTKSRRYI